MKQASSPLVKVLSFYSGENGLYACVYPTPKSCQLISDFCLFNGISEAMMTPMHSWHCTIMHSEQCPPRDKLPFIDRFQTYQAALAEFEHWEGHDKQGYVVCRLDCDDFHKLHAQWRSAGCKPTTFDEYKPHLTLIEGEKASPWVAEYLNRCLKKQGSFTLAFGSHNVEDAKS